MTVTSTLVAEVQNKAEGFIMSHWLKDVCPWLYSFSDQVHLVEFLNNTCLCVDQYLTKLGVIKPHNSDDPHRHWISTGTTFFQARSGVATSSKTSVTGACKPDIVLMTSDSHEWSDVMSIIDVKYHYTKALLKASKEYMVEVSQLVFTNQVHCRFFVGALLTGPEMRIALFTCGCGAFSEPIDIYANPIRYIQVLSWFMHTELWYLGYNTYYEAPTFIENLSLWLMKANSTTKADMVWTSVLSIIYNSIAGFGRTTRVMAVRGPKQRPGVDQETLIVKEVWQIDAFSLDGDIHKLLEDKERLQKARIKLGVL
ncbi:hypothetical protein AZE42_13330 [Rhizopogon vesiculosus]|uniref:Fungal-type protein kinase domain-containing protein n=1 Tax=Rhizopogon vesiculosus TaxID=180088 RepID=A0A1J8Q411_9AGAM|nr:hypothetical protein AZE42_13330 [Rhizopogon vesiculosus]